MSFRLRKIRNGRFFLSQGAALALVAVLGSTPAQAQNGNAPAKYPATPAQIKLIQAGVEQYMHGPRGFSIDLNSLRNFFRAYAFGDTIEIHAELTFNSNDFDKGKSGTLKAQFEDGNLTYLSICDYYALCDKPRFSK